MGRKILKRHGLSKRERLIRRGDFEATYRERKSAADDRLVVYVRPNGLGFSRLGLSVGARFGNAVRRNRFRRICREAFRLHKRELPRGCDIIIVPRRIDLSLEEVAGSLVMLTRKLCAEKMEPKP